MEQGRVLIFGVPSEGSKLTLPCSFEGNLVPARAGCTLRELEKIAFKVLLHIIFSPPFPMDCLDREVEKIPQMGTGCRALALAE